jgi:hypothetical protein
MTSSQQRDRQESAAAPESEPFDSLDGEETEKAKMETVPPSSSSRRARYREPGRRSTQRVRPWSQLPGVTAYLVFDPTGQLTDKWGDPGSDGIAKADSFRQRAGAGALSGSFALEPAGDDLRLLSVARPDGWFVHVWLLADSNVTGVLSVIGG